MSTYLKTRKTFVTILNFKIRHLFPIYRVWFLVISMLSPVAAKLFLRQINVWLECKNTDNIIWHVLTKFESGTLTHIRLLWRHQHYQYLTPTSEIPFMKLTSIASNIVTNVVPSNQTCGQINAKNQQYNCLSVSWA